MKRENVRNFCIIAHIDHGKSTLADRLLEATGTVAERDMQAQLLDTMDIERERGITIKLNAARMNYTSKSGEKYIFNLIDTPGHVDFSYEVSRSLAACEGALLIVDATQGVEAQTLANVYMAIEQNLEIIPVINKIDLPSADVERVKKEIEDILGIDASHAIPVSAKTGVGIDEVLEAIVDIVPPPVDTSEKPLRALVFDSAYDPYLGTLCFFKIMDGKLKLGDKVRFMASGKEYDVVEIGYLTPNRVQVEELVCGDVGYFAGSIKEITRFVGDTVTLVENPASEPLPGYKEALPMVFSGMYPVDNEDYHELKEALEKLKLSDSSITFEPETYTYGMAKTLLTKADICAKQNVSSSDYIFYGWFTEDPTNKGNLKALATTSQLSNSTSGNKTFYGRFFKARETGVEGYSDASLTINVNLNSDLKSGENFLKQSAIIIKIIIRLSFALLSYQSKCR